MASPLFLGLNGMTSDEFRCERADLFERLSDRAWFIEFVKFQYESVGFFGTRLSPSLSTYNLIESFGSYRKDTKELEQKENRGDSINEIKRSAFFSYWLRRTSPVYAIGGAAIDATKSDLTEAEVFLIRYANEFCAFDLGFRICRYFVSRSARSTDISVGKKTSEQNASEVRALLFALGTINNAAKANVNGPRGGAHSPKRHNTIANVTFPKSFLIDVCHLLKEKNVSPHALYIIFSAFFIGYNDGKMPLFRGE